MTQFYVLRLGTQFKIAQLDSAGALSWHEKGWELGQHPHDSREEAEQAMEQWKENIRKTQIG